ncbi:DnaJ-domain-containing protein [Cylindrobasidium torrendii FP15055 ss-10]|uniref:DnaJ-domain-containing protein n=1 Tax=Cylindrobasidium torrendii FP15055 ss-10 TaxID=1314674 RepID=A0A0D7BKA6_9AGAR|nr:DnaJ-domain-containing protein [Cylindrobasidium torrendii FP15055 ss-10]
MDTFFPDEDTVDLYAVLETSKDASADDIKKAYRKLALKHHPDKGGDAARFQQIGFAYTILSTPASRTVYDTTGSTSNSTPLDPGAGGWDAYFSALFERVTKRALDDMKAAYVGSDEERRDVEHLYRDLFAPPPASSSRRKAGKKATIETLMDGVMFAEYTDETRIVALVESLIEDGVIERVDAWTNAGTGKEEKKKRMKKGEKEAREAEQAAKDIGVWDDFYGGGKGKPASKGKDKKGTKGKVTKDDEGEGEEEDVLKAMILKRNKQREEQAGSFLDGLAEKYAPKSKGKGKRKQAEVEEEEIEAEKPSKRARTSPVKKKTGKGRR